MNGACRQNRSWAYNRDEGRFDQYERILDEDIAVVAARFKPAFLPRLRLTAGSVGTAHKAVLTARAHPPIILAPDLHVVGHICAHEWP
jgi:hypothetical protein